MDGVAHIVGDHQRGQVVLPDQAVGDVHDPLGRLGIQRRGMLVQQQQLGLLQGGHQQRQRLTLSAREGAHLGGQAILQTQTQLPQTAAIILALAAADAGAQGVMPAAALRQSQVLLDLHAGGGTHHGVLVYAAQVAGALVLRQRGNVDAVQLDAALVGLPGAADGVLHGALSGAVAADDGDEIPVPQRQAQVVQRHALVHGAAVEGLGDVIHFQHGRCLLSYCGNGLSVVL